MKALSIRQPWAWLIVNGYKTVENRSRSLGNHTGPLLIHASSKMSENDYSGCVEFLRCNPKLRLLLRHLPSAYTGVLRVGGIVGVVECTARIEYPPTAFYMAKAFRQKDYEWYLGKIGYVLGSAKPLPFKHCKGRLGFFDVDYEGLPV